jgi:hypothetical protein
VACAQREVSQHVRPTRGHEHNPFFFRAGEGVQNIFKGGTAKAFDLALKCAIHEIEGDGENVLVCVDV